MILIFICRHHYASLTSHFSSAFAVVLRGYTRCSWTLPTSGLHMYCISTQRENDAEDFILSPIYTLISACLTDISCWMKDQLNLAKTEPLVVSANPSFHHNFTFQLGTSTITPSKPARNLGVMIDDQLTFSDHITKITQSCRFALFTIKKIRPFLLDNASQLLVLLFCPDLTITMLSWQVFQPVLSNLYN